MLANLKNKLEVLLNQKNLVSIYGPLKLIYIDIIGPTKTTSLRDKIYGLVIINDFAWFTWILFLV